ncbi:hypothetical protein [Shinella sp. M31]|uniref:hypothetical protein n=1 Tax=Shinella sp. M31 TaxID=3368615 RepID=UPI003BA1215B
MIHYASRGMLFGSVLVRHSIFPLLWPIGRSAAPRVPRLLNKDVRFKEAGKPRQALRCSRVGTADRKPAPYFHELDAGAELLHQSLAVIDAMPVAPSAIHVDLLTAEVSQLRERHANLA